MKILTRKSWMLFFIISSFIGMLEFLDNSWVIDRIQEYLRIKQSSVEQYPWIVHSTKELIVYHGWDPSRRYSWIDSGHSECSGDGQSSSEVLVWRGRAGDDPFTCRTDNIFKYRYRNRAWWHWCRSLRDATKDQYLSTTDRRSVEGDLIVVRYGFNSERFVSKKEKMMSSLDTDVDSWLDWELIRF